MNKVEEVARAMALDSFERSGNEPETRDEYVELVYPTLLPFARAAIAAMEKPTEGMKAAAPRIPHARDEEIYTAMILAALSEEGE